MKRSLNIFVTYALCMALFCAFSYPYDIFEENINCSLLEEEEQEEGEFDLFEFILELNTFYLNYNNLVAVLNINDDRERLILFDKEISHPPNINCSKVC